jgi:hypothetical protein
MIKNPQPTARLGATNMIAQNFTVVVNPQKAGDQVVYVAQCVEFDLCVQGKTLEEVKMRFLKSVWGHVIIAMECGLKPFACLAPGYRQPEGESVTMAVEKFPATPSRDCIPKRLHQNWDFIPRGEVLLQVR